MGLFDLWY